MHSLKKFIHKWAHSSNPCWSRVNCTVNYQPEAKHMLHHDKHIYYLPNSYLVSKYVLTLFQTFPLVSP